MDQTIKIYADRDYVDSKGLPDGAGANMQLVTDGNGNAVWEEKLAYTAEVELLPETTATSERADIAIGTIQVWESGVLTSPVKAGDKVVFTLDGQTYNVTLMENTNPFTGEMDGWLDDGSGGATLYQTDDGHGVGFAVSQNAEGQVVVLICVGGDFSPFTATASLVGNGVKTIDPKFLPKGVGGEKTYIINGTGVGGTYTAGFDYADLNAELNAGNFPKVVIKMDANDVTTISRVGAFTLYDGAICMSWDTAGSNTDRQWLMMDSDNTILDGTQTS